MRRAAALFLIALFAMSWRGAHDRAFAQDNASTAQTVMVVVNGDPVTVRDIVQQALYRNLGGTPERANAFVERVNNVLTNDTAVKEKFKQKMDAAQPHSPAEIQKAAERVKKELVEDAIWQVVSQDGAMKTAAIESVIANRLKLQAAKRFGIDVTDEEVERGLIVDRLAAGDIYAGTLPDMNAYYARREENGVSRRTIREIMRAELAWRAVLHRVYGAATGLEATSAYESFGRGYLGKLRQHAMIEHRE